MKKSALAALSLAVIGTTLHAASAQAVGVAQIAWTDTTHTDIKISWPTHDGPLRVVSKSPNRADIALADQTSADQVVISKGQLQQGSTDVLVEVRDATSKELVGQTPHFDTVAPSPKLGSATMSSSIGISVEWRFLSSTGSDDTTPNDPLDVTPSAATVRMTGTNGCTWTDVQTLSGQRGITTLPYQKPPFRVSAYADTEWGGVQDASLAVVNFAMGQQVPASAPYGDALRIPITSDAIRPGKCTDGVAAAPYKVPVNTIVALHARPTSTAPWSEIPGSIFSEPQLKGLSTPSIGARQYRAVAYNNAHATIVSGADPELRWVVGYSAVTPAASAITPYKLQSAKFAQSSVTLGQKVNAMLEVKPYTNLTATIQKWNGKAWGNWSSVPVRSGDGTYSYKPTTRGTHTFRFLVPSSTYGGLKIDWIATKSFSLTVR